jgi:hypothetical protein
MKSPFPGMDPYLERHWQELIGRCYHHGRYDDLDGQADPTPPFTPSEAQWVDQWLAACGLRRGSSHTPDDKDSKT